MKNKIILIFILIAIIFISLIVLIFINQKNKNNQKEIEKTITDITELFYENYYYPNIALENDDKKRFLQKFSDTGIKVSLENLIKYSKVSITLKNEITDEECDKQKTTITIYPTMPYNKEDYQINIDLVCGF